MPPDPETPVTRAECGLHRALIEQRFGTLERDMQGTRADVAEMKETLTRLSETMHAFEASMSDKQSLLLRVLVLVLLLVLAGRGLDVSSIVGGI